MKIDFDCNNSLPGTKDEKKESTMAEDEGEEKVQLVSSS
jgi:hypothetical protein